MIKYCIDRVIVPLLFLTMATVVSLCSICSLENGDETDSAIRLYSVEEENKRYISPYDALFQGVAAKMEMDWLLLLSIARAESEFRADAVSRSGAVGLMQVMPFVASSMGVSRDELFIPERNIEVAAELLSSIKKMYGFKDSMDEAEQIKFILAAYNAGYSRISDARRLARYFEDDDCRWHIVASYLALLSEEEYSEHEVVRYGAFYGSDETISYVDKVLHIYNLYRSRIVVL